MLYKHIVTSKKIFLSAVVLAMGCGQPAKQEDYKKTDTVVQDSQLIVPGKSIGEIKLNDNADSLLKKMGKPNFNDAAMGSSFMAWYTDHDKPVSTISIYAQRNMGAADEAINHIKQIRITSPSFKTSNNIGVGVGLKSIQDAYTLKTHSVPGAKAHTKLLLYNDYKAGIGFEVDSTEKCMAILVYAKGDTSTTLINMRADLGTKK